MPEWQATAHYSTSLGCRAIWQVAYADVAAWPRWNREIAAATIDRPLALGTVARIRFRGGTRARFHVVEFTEGELFTDEARLPGARMGHRHRLEEAASGGTRLINTIYLRGPLAHFWRLLLGRRAARSLPLSQRAIVELVLGPTPRPRQRRAL